MAAPLVIKSTDANVPVLSGTEGSLAAIFRYAAPLLNWDIVFDSGAKIVIRAKTGLKLLYRIDDKATRSATAPRVASITAYESMSDIDTGSGLVGPTFIVKSTVADGSARPWLISADDTFINFCCGPWNSAWNYNSYNGSYSGFGDAVKVFPDIDYSPAVLVGCFDTTGDPQFWPFFDPIEDTHSTNSKLHRSIDGSVMNINTQFHANCPFNMGRFGNTAAANLPAYPFNGKLLLSRPVLSQGSSASDGFPHTYVPGLFNPLHKSGFTGGVIVTDGADSYFPIKYTYSGQYGCALLKIAGEFRE